METTNFTWLPDNFSSVLVGEDSAHVPVRLKPLSKARVLWLNMRAACCDPKFRDLEFDAALYEKHILQSCAYLTAENENQDDEGNETLGYADRYGGTGIGANGGSGRSVFANGYIVKGIGRTPLVSALADFGHASGGCYLEESVRETIFSEIVHSEFPHSAVPTLAIIDTGLVQRWPHDVVGKAVERRVLMVRPPFIRPAHFMRATGFISRYTLEGSLDARRVELFFRHAIDLYTKDELIKLFRDLFLKWSHQLAYAFVHRLSHGSNTPSNLSFDGALLDFGAASAVPSWADVATMLTPCPFSTQHNAVVDGMRELSYFFQRYVDGDVASHIHVFIAEARFHYRRCIVYETLRLCGLPLTKAESEAAEGRFEHHWPVIRSVIRYFQAEQIDLTVPCEDVQRRWDIWRVWDSVAPPHLVSLQGMLADIVSPCERTVVARNCLFLSRDRSRIYREDFRRRLVVEIDLSDQGLDPDRITIENAINRYVADARRDHRMEVPSAFSVGFAVGTRSSYALFKDVGCGALFAVEEQQHSKAMRRANEIGRSYIRKWTSREIDFNNPNTGSFEGSVSVIDPYEYP